MTETDGILRSDARQLLALLFAVNKATETQIDKLTGIYPSRLHEVYPLLHQLGLVTVTTSRNIAYYSLTTTGIRRVTELLREFEKAEIE